MATQPINNAVPNELPRDLKFNAGKIVEFVTSLAHQYIDRTVIYLDDTLPAKDGSVECAPALNAAVQSTNTRKGVTTFSAKSSVYIFDNRVSFTGVEGVEFDFAWAMINDNVQCAIAETQIDLITRF